MGDIGNSQSLNRYAYCEGNPVSMVDPFGLSPEKSWLGILFDTFKSQLTVHDVLGFLGMIPVAGFVFDLFDAGVYLYERDPVKAGLSVVCAIPEVGDIIAVAKNGTKLAKTAKVVSNAIRTVQKTYVTAASASAALELAGDAKLEYAVNGGQKTSSVKAKIGAAALFTGLAIVSGKSLAKDLSRFSNMADVHFKTTKLERAENTSGKTIQYGGVGGCFTAGTIVKTAEGDRNIEDIKTGDYVLSEDPEIGEQDYRKVVRTFIREKYTIIHVFVGNEEIETTEEHPFYVEGTGFVPAGGLEAGYIIRTADGRNLPIEKVEREELQKPVLVYNFEVEDFHTYYVSATGVLVHNTCGEKINAGKTIAGGNKTTKLKYVSSNGLILETTPGRTTTILGTYDSDTHSILEELGNVKSMDFGPRTGGFNLLNVPDELYVSPNQFWNDYNRPWLDNVISRNDIIRLATEPEWNNLTRINKITGKIELTGFGREYNYLRKNGYRYNKITKTMYK